MRRRIMIDEEEKEIRDRIMRRKTYEEEDEG